MSDKSSSKKKSIEKKTTEGIGGGSLGQALLVPVLAVVTGLILGGVVMIATGANPIEAYSALFAGAFGTPSNI
ncbi:MAG: hypothetical protein HC797_06565, partial [Anaerolineales bacterium]|nr:hypothetical protein [Anaerolineales bacterium]